MEKPDLPEDEQLRIETLYSLKLLDTLPEERFDRLTRLAKRMFNVPIALVCLVDTNRQWFKSIQGIEATETPRDISFCGHAILGHDILLIPNALEDVRFADNPLVTEEPHIRFYAGIPLKVLNGSKVGTLCVIDKEPREFSQEDVELLQDLAAMAEQEISAAQLATLDELTKISNRRGFTALATHALSLCNRVQTPSSMLFFDLDGFKEINDTCGHAVGDKVLIAFAEQMKKVFRDSDVFARTGGDEFVALLTGATADEIGSLLSRFQASVDEYNNAEDRGYLLKYSVGAVTCGKAVDESIEDLLAKADAAMYEDKQLHKTSES